MRSLFKTLCNNDFGLPGHSIIKHMHYDASGSDQSICGILYQIAKTTTIGILDKSGFLMVDLRPVPRQFRIRSTIHQEENDRTISFSKDDIVRFVNDINDTNEIHREPPYVVPGCMILENLWNYWNISKSAQQMAIYFHAPVIWNRSSWNALLRCLPRRRRRSRRTFLARWLKLPASTVTRLC